MGKKYEPLDLSRYISATWTLGGSSPVTYTFRYVPTDSLPKVDGRPVAVGATLYVKSGPNKHARVEVCGYNLEREPICQRLDGQPFIWNGVRRHVLDFPVDVLSWQRPPMSVREAAEAVSIVWDQCAGTRPSIPGELRKALAALDDALADDPDSTGWKPF